MIACDICGFLAVPAHLAERALALHMRTRHPVIPKRHEHVWDYWGNCMICPKGRILLDEAFRRFPWQA